MSDSNFFVAKAGDWAAEAIGTLNAQEGILASAALAYNSIFLALGGSLFIYMAVRSIIDTAQLGKLGGKHSEVWFPIRFIMAVSLLVPLPPSGFNFGQLIVFGVGRAGVAAGSYVWLAAVNSASKLQPLIVPVPPEVKKLAGQLFMIEFCKAMENQTAQSSTAPTIIDPPTQLDGILSSQIRYDGDPNAGGINGQCGSIKFSKLANTQVSPTFDVSSTLQSHITATNALQKSLQPLAASLAQQFLPPYPGAGQDPSSVDVIGAERQYTSSIMATARAYVQARNQNALASFQDAASSRGWVNAGAWALNLMSANQSVQDAVSGLPEISPPKEDFWQGNTYVAQKAALAGARKWWDEHWGAKNSTTDPNAYNATSDSSVGWQLGSIFDISRYKFIYDSILMGYSGGSDSNLAGAAAPTVFGNQTEQNPIAEMTSLGHNLLLAAWTSVLAFAGLESIAAVVKQVTSNLASAAGSIPIVGAIMGGADSVVSGESAGALQFLEAVGPMVWLLILGLFSGGFLLAYVLPLTPALLWFFGVCRYLMSVAMTVLGSNLWAIAHLELEGDGMGQKATPGYLALLGLIARPAVMVMGLIMGLAVMVLMGKLFGVLYFEMVRNSLTGHYGGITGLVAFTVIGSGAIITLVAACMWGVGGGVDYVMGLIGERLAGHGEAERDAKASSGGVDQVSSRIESGGVRHNNRTGGHGADTPATGDEAAAINSTVQEKFIAKDGGGQIVADP